MSEVGASIKLEPTNGGKNGLLQTERNRNPGGGSGQSTRTETGKCPRGTSTPTYHSEVNQATTEGTCQTSHRQILIRLGRPSGHHFLRLGTRSAHRVRNVGELMILLTIGLVIAVTPTMLGQVWNGQSLLGAIIVAVAGYRLIGRERTNV